MHSFEQSRNSEIGSNHAGVTALFLFDYYCDETPEGRTVFQSIRNCLEKSQGICALNDTGVLSAGTLAQLANKAVSAKTVDGGVVDTQQYDSIAAAVAAMWTDRPENVEIFHDYLNRHTVPRYQGAVLLDEDVSYGEFLGLCARWSGPVATARTSLWQNIVGVGLEMYHGLVEWLQPFYARIRGRCAGSRFKLVGVSSGIVLALALLTLLFTRDPSVAPEVETAVTPVVDPVVAREVETVVAPAVGPVPEVKKTVVAPTVEPVPEVKTVVAPPVDPVSELEQSAGSQTSMVQSFLKAEEPSEKLSSGVGSNSGNVTVIKPVNKANAVARAPRAPFTLQVGSFRSAKSAAGLLKRLKLRGYPAFVSKAKVSGGRTTHRVRVGAFKTRQMARAFGEKLKQREPFITDSIVILNK